MTLSVGIFLFPQVEILDFTGPYEVFTTASRVHAKRAPFAPLPFRVFTVAAESLNPIRARAGLHIIPDHTFADHPPIDLLIVPGGVVLEELRAPAVIAWIRSVAMSARITASVCTGAFLLAEAGLLTGRKATTHWEDIAELRSMYPGVDVVGEGRWIDEGEVITSAGISAGIDMSLHLVERFLGHDLALATARQLDFEWRAG